MGKADAVGRGTSVPLRHNVQGIPVGDELGYLECGAVRCERFGQMSSHSQRVTSALMVFRDRDLPIIVFTKLGNGTTKNSNLCFLETSFNLAKLSQTIAEQIKKTKE